MNLTRRQALLGFLACLAAPAEVAKVVPVIPSRRVGKTANFGLLYGPIDDALLAASMKEICEEEDRRFLAELDAAIKKFELDKKHGRVRT